MYDPEMVQPMREELTNHGVTELLTAEDVDTALSGKEGTTLVVVNSVCGCAAGSARPGVLLALDYEVTPDNIYTVFAGQDAEATNQARSYFSQYPPSSPSIALLKDGECVFMLERQHIEGRSPQEVAMLLADAFKMYCKKVEA